MLGNSGAATGHCFRNELKQAYVILVDHEFHVLVKTGAATGQHGFSCDECPIT